MALIKSNKNNRRDSLAFPAFDSLFNDFFNSDSFYSGSKMPAVNVSENEKEYLVELNAPGFKKEDLKVTVKDDILTVAAEVNNEKKESEKNYSRKEYAHTSFSRSFSLPDSVDIDSVNGNYENGILKISVPKQEAPTTVHREVKID